MIYCRALQIEDEEQILRIDNISGDDICESVMWLLDEGFDDCSYGIFDDNKLIGYLCLSGASPISNKYKEVEAWDSYLSCVYILRQYRGKQLGSKLLAYALSHSSQADKPIWGEIKKSSLMNFYAPFGFELIYPVKSNKMGLIYRPEE